MTQPYSYPSSGSIYPLPSTSSSSTHPDHFYKPAPEPLQPPHRHQQHDANHGYRSSSSSTNATSSSSGHLSTSASPYSSHSSLLTSGSSSSGGGGGGSSAGAGASQLLQQHQANQHAFRSNSGQHAFVFYPPSSNADMQQSGSASREGSANSSRGSDGGVNVHHGGSSGGDVNDPSSSYYDPFRIKHRRRTSPPQLKILEHHFDINPKPDVTTRKALSEKLDMTPREVQVWFQNRRAKVKKLREKAEREPNSATEDTASPPSTSHAPPPPSSSNKLKDAASDLPIPPTLFPSAQSDPARTVYGHDAISQRRESPPSISSYYAQPGSTMLPTTSAEESFAMHSYGGPTYQSTVYTTTVASSTYARNEYLPAPPSAAFGYLPQDVVDPSKRFSLPPLGGNGEHHHQVWSQSHVPPPALPLSNDPTSFDRFPHYAPPVSSAFASSALPPPIDDHHSLPSYPAYSSYNLAPTTTHHQNHDRRASYATSDSSSLIYEPPATTSSVTSQPSFSLPPAQGQGLPQSTISSFDQFDLTGESSSPPSAGPIRRSSLAISGRLANHRSSQSSAIKPYDVDRKPSPSSLSLNVTTTVSPVDL